MVSIFRTFKTKQDARDYRYNNSTGGWIFVPEDGTECILFPPEMAPIDIFHHWITKGKVGDLLGNS